jgi:NUMOD4 motif
MTQEIEWRDVKGFEGFYQVSNTGRVRSLDRHNDVRIFKGRELSPHKNNEGNRIVSLRGLTKRDIVVNQLVAQTFLPHVTGARSVRHIDGDRSNNHVSNLEWIVRKGRWPKGRLPKGRGRKLDPDKVACIRASIAKGVSLTELSNLYQVHLSMISRIKSNKAWKDKNDDEIANN